MSKASIVCLLIMLVNIGAYSFFMDMLAGLGGRAFFEIFWLFFPKFLLGQVPFVIIGTIAQILYQRQKSEGTSSHSTRDHMEGKRKSFPSISVVTITCLIFMCMITLSYIPDIVGGHSDWWLLVESWIKLIFPLICVGGIFQWIHYVKKRRSVNE